MTDIDHDTAAELLGAYALDAVDPDEETLVAEHLRGCESCTVELASFREVTGFIANSGGDAPEHLWSSIAERVADGPTSLQEGTTRLLEAARVGRSSRRSQWRARPWVTGAVAAGLVLVAGLGVAVGQLAHRVDQLQGEGAGPALTQAADSALGNPAARRVVLTGADRPSQAVAQIAILPSGAGFLVNRGLTPLGRDRTYQLWARVGGDLVSVGVLGAAPTDVAFHVDPGVSIAAFAITAERAGGVTTTTHAPVASSRTTA